ncbi:MAG: glycosyltransferase 87 family protein [Silvibacterium sp.]
MPVPDLAQPVKNGSEFQVPFRGYKAAYYSIVLIGCLAFLVLGVHRQSRVFKFRDFKQPYASARCLLAHCNPYSEQDTEAQYSLALGPNNDARVFVPYSALYPPPALLLLVPVAALPYPVAHAVWMILLIASFCGAALLVASLCEAYGSLLPALGIAFFVGNSDELVMLGQVSGITIALACFGFWAMLRNKTTLAGACFACAVCLKPHDIFFFLPYFLLAGRPWRRALAKIVAIAAAITLAGILWCSLTPASSHWLRDLRTNIAGNSASGSINDPTPANSQADAIVSLQTVFSVFNPERSFYTTASYATTGILFLMWLYGAMRVPNSLEKHLLSIATLACLTLLPIYHRHYDTRLLLLLFPAIALMLARHRVFGVIALTLFSVEIFPQIGYIFYRAHPSLTNMSELHFLIAYRLVQLSILALAVFFATIFAREAWAKDGKLILSPDIDPV